MTLCWLRARLYAFSGIMQNKGREPGAVESSCMATSVVLEGLSTLLPHVLDTLNESHAPSTRRLYALEEQKHVKAMS